MKNLILLLLASCLLPLHSKTVLFDGKTDGWKMAGPGSFEIKGGVATAKGGMGLWWHKTEFHNFSLHLQFKMEDAKHNSGVFLRFPNPGDDPWVAVRQGYEIQISGKEAGNKSTGSIYDIQSGITPPLKVGEWNDYHLIAANEKIAVILNGKLINIFTTQKGRGDFKGHIGIQNHDDNSPVQFRNISVIDRGKGGTLLEVLASAGVPRSELTSYWAKVGGKQDWFKTADHGPAFFQSFSDYYQGKYRPESAIKGLSLSYSSIPSHKALFNCETLGLISANRDGTQLDNTPWGGGHGKVNKFQNKDYSLFTTSSPIVWADENGMYEDTRELKGHGNMPGTKFLGYLRNGNGIILHYAVHGTEIHDYLADNRNGLARLMEIGPHGKELVCRLADTSSEENFTIKVIGEGAEIKVKNDSYYLHLAPQPRKRPISLLYSRSGEGEPIVPVTLSSYLKAGDGISPETFTVEAKLDESGNPWLVDTIPLPPTLNKSPYLSKVRMSDFDFFPGGDRALLSTWDGDIWHISGLKEFKTLTWKRYATGFFEPLGLRIVDGIPYIAGRDALWTAEDTNGDHEADFFKIFNNDVLITNNFHEFQFGLETDKDNNFYFAKGSPVRPGGRGFDKIVPHNGAFMKVSADGSTLEVLATGLRAPGGIGVGPNGEITTGENEGSWQPCCKVNYFEPTSSTKGFFGVENARHGVETDFSKPLCYLPMNVDNSGGGQIWVEDGAKLGIPTGELLHLSYGRSSIYHVLRQKVGKGTYQGGVTKLPIKLGSSAQRAAFHPDGSMYVCGFRGWQTNAATASAFQRVRRNTDAIFPLPTAMEVTKDGVKITFANELDNELATDPASFTIQRWDYVRGPQYGSGHFSVDKINAEARKNALEKESQKHRVQDKVEVTSAELLEDKKSILIKLAGHKPCNQMRIDYDLETIDGDELIGSLHNTIHAVPAN
ncbi:MAG: 3-keto-disaccharide hydrolase [Akkermansiaceae bacterium]